MLTVLELDAYETIKHELPRIAKALEERKKFDEQEKLIEELTNRIAELEKRVKLLSGK